MSTPFAEAKAWRAGDAETRASIEAQITREDRWSQFRFGSMGQLVARLTPADWKRITASGGGAYAGTSADREFWRGVVGDEQPVRFTKLVGGFVVDADDDRIAA